ncbi:MAG: hypothetical protein JO272_05070 [Pseudonocardiales bacterium]|nr:hypothetical protein [Pseudonocardiales bacterium]
MDRRVRRAVLERLAGIEEMAARASAVLSAPSARRHITAITGVWRELLSQHLPDSTGRCTICSGWLRRRHWPCKVWMTAQRHLLGDDPEPIKRFVRNSDPFCRPREVEVVPRQFSAPAAEQTTVRNVRPRGEAGKAVVHRA